MVTAVHTVCALQGAVGGVYHHHRNIKHVIKAISRKVDTNRKRTVLLKEVQLQSRCCMQSVHTVDSLSSLPQTLG